MASNGDCFQEFLDYCDVTVRPILKDLVEHVSPAYGANWKSIGLHLGIQSGSLQIIEHDNHHKALNCCNAMFTEWLDVDGSASWGKLKKALRSIIATTAKELTPAIHNGTEPLNFKLCDHKVNQICCISGRLAFQWILVALVLKIPDEVINTIDKTETNPILKCERLLTYWFENHHGASIESLLEILNKPYLMHELKGSIKLSQADRDIIEHNMVSSKIAQNYADMLFELIQLLRKHSDSFNIILEHLELHPHVKFKPFENAKSIKEIVKTLENEGHLSPLNVEFLNWLVKSIPEAQTVIKNYEESIYDEPIADELQWCMKQCQSTDRSFVYAKILGDPHIITYRDLQRSKKAVSDFTGISESEMSIKLKGKGSIFLFWKIPEQIAERSQLPHAASLRIKYELDEAKIVGVGICYKEHNQYVLVSQLKTMVWYGYETGLDMGAVCKSPISISVQVAETLREDYIKARNSNADCEWPPNQPATIVNVALIHYKGRRTQQELIEVVKRCKGGTPAIDKLTSFHSRSASSSHLYTRVTKNIREIFTTCHSSDLVEPSYNQDNKAPQFILIEGAPGIGKTVLAKEISYLWAKKKMLHGIEILILLFLQHPELKRIKSELQLAQYIMKSMCDLNYTDEQLENLVVQLKALHICVVLDGYDEYPDSLRKKSFITNLIKGKIFPNAVVVVTSRPSASLHLHGIVDRRIEILGFAQKERDEYIVNSLRGSPDKQKHLIFYLRCHPIINSLLYIPLHLAVLLHLFKAHSKLPETLTEINEYFIIHTIYRNLTKLEVIPRGLNTEVYCFQHLPRYPDVYGIICNLSKLAFTSLQSNQLAFTYDEIKKCVPVIDTMEGAINGYGLLQAVQHFSYRGHGETVSFNFLHFTMQEYLAAFYLSTVCSSKHVLPLARSSFWDGDYQFVWMMYAGINGITSHVFNHYLCKSKEGTLELKLSKDIKCNKIKCLHLFQCFVEAKSDIVDNDVFCLFKNGEINFHSVRLHPHHVSTLLSYICKYDVQIHAINLRNCHIGDTGMSILEQFFTMYPEKASTIKHIDLFGNNSPLLWQVYCSIFEPKILTALDWSSLGGVDIDEIVTALYNNNTIESLKISDNHFTDNGAKKIANILSHNTTLKELDISNNDIFTTGAIAVSESLKHNTTLQCIKISWNKVLINTELEVLDLSRRNIRDTGVQITVGILYNNKKVVCLNLSQNKISDKGAIYLSDYMKNNHCLKEINLSRNHISSKGIRGIITSIIATKSLLKFDISCNGICDDGAIAISEFLMNNNTLQNLSISANKITSTGAIKIGESIKENFSLRNLDISSNNISDEGANTIIKCLLTNNTVQVLNMSANNISSTGAIQFGKTLEVNSQLMELDMSQNKINDEGIMTISECLKRNKTLLSFNISSNGISSLAAARKIGEIIETNFTLQTLEISLDNIFTSGALAISKYLKRNNSLQKLIISWNNNHLTLDAMAKSFNMSNKHYGNTEAALISTFLQNNSAVQMLDLSSNNVSDIGAVSICELLKCNHTLQSLNISGNKITNTGAIRIFEAIETNLKLCTLDISNNRISQDSIIAIAPYFKKNNDLQKVSISWNTSHLVLDDTLQSYNMSNEHYGSIGATLISAFLQKNSTVKTLNLSSNSISDDGAASIAKCIKYNRTLQNLNISRNRITSIGVFAITSSIKKTSELKTLNLSFNNISDEGAIHISKCLNSSSIQSLKIAANNITNIGTLRIFEVLKTNFTMKEIDISHIKVSKDDAITISECLKMNNTLQKLSITWNSNNLVLDTTVQSLKLSNKHYGNIEVILLSALLQNNDTRVEALNFSCNNVSDDGAIAISEYLTNGCTLQSLNISKNSITSCGATRIFNAIQENTVLRKFDISWNSIVTNAVIDISKCIKKNKTLQELRVSWKENSQWCNRHILLDATVQSFRLSKMHYGDTEVTLISSFIQNNTTVKYLDLSGNDLSDDGAIAISECLENNYTLQSLDISCNKITNIGVIIISRGLKKNKTLQKLTISWSGTDQWQLSLDGTVQSWSFYNEHFCDTGAILISAYLKNNTTVQYLDLSKNNISDDGVTAVSECLRINNTLQSINISSNKITNVGVARACKAIEINTSLLKLDISNNIISDDGAIVISEFLINNSPLQTLDISHNKITSVGAVRVFKAIKFNTSLLKLDVSNNNISDDGVVAVGECLMSRSTLQNLNISNNKITSNGAVIICKAIKINTSLLKLDISNNNIADDGAVAISECLKENHEIREINLSGNLLTIDGIKIILETKVFVSTLNLRDNIISKSGMMMIANIYKVISHKLTCDISFNELCSTDNHGAYVVNTTALCLNNKDDCDFSKIATFNKTLFDMSERDGDYKAAVISCCLRSNNSVEHLDLSHHSITYNGVKHIADALIVNTSLKTLDISHNQITDDGAIAISKCIYNNCLLQCLNVSKNSLTSFGAIKIFKAIEANYRLQKLDILYNDLSYHAILIISECLKMNKTLQKLLISWMDTYQKQLVLDSTVKSWDFCNYQYGDTGAILISSYLQYNSTITSLKLSSNKISDDGAIAISECVINNNTLQCLNISYNKVTSAGAVRICKSIETNSSLLQLDISHNNISDDGVFAICKCLKLNNTLHSLKIAHNNISCAGVTEISEGLKNNKTLLELRISWKDTYQSEWQRHLNANIHSWNLCDKHYGDSGAILVSAFLQNNATVKTLNFSCNEISDDGAIAISEYLKRSSNLQNLNISNNKITSIGSILICKAIKINTSLLKLDISNNNITDNGAVAISECLKENCTLREINLSGNLLTIDGIKIILETKVFVNTLNLRGNIISKSGLMMIANIYKVMGHKLTCNISFNELCNTDNHGAYVVNTTALCLNNKDDCDFSKIATFNKTLFDMSERDGDYKAAVISCCLRSNNSVRCLDLSHHDITYKGVKYIADTLIINTSLTILDISYNCISDKGAIAFSECLMNSRNLQSITFSYNNITSVGAAKICEAVKSNSTLLQLDISNNNTHDDGAIGISECLKSNDIIEVLDISCSKITSVGAVKVFKTIEYNTSLLKLNISSNEISDDGVGTVCECVKNNKILQCLNISNNRITSIGVIKLVEGLKKNRTLQYLKISWMTNFQWWSEQLILDATVQSWSFNSMHYGDTGAILISAFLHNNCSVQELNLSVNDISDHGAVAISECLSNNSTLRELDLSGNMITIEGVKSILESDCYINVLNLINNNISQPELITIVKWSSSLCHKLAIHISFKKACNTKCNEPHTALCLSNTCKCNLLKYYNCVQQSNFLQDMSDIHGNYEATWQLAGYHLT